jgi:hypothetical protein
MTGYDIFIIIVVLGLMFGTGGCSTSTLVKDCKKVESEETYKCKTLKPWE